MSLFFIVMFISIFQKNIAIFLFNIQSYISIIVGSFVFVLIIINSIEILNREGMLAFHSRDDLFLGKIGNLFLHGFCIFVSLYTAIIVIILIVLDKFPNEVPEDGLFFIFLFMLYLFGWSGFQISFLFRQFINNPFLGKEINDIIYCSDLTSEKIKELFKPKTKNDEWYYHNCINVDEIPNNSFILTC